MMEFGTIFILFQACFFFHYISNLLKNALKNMKQNTTEVERVKKIEGAKLTKLRCLEKVFGEYIILYWIPSFHSGYSNYLELTYKKDSKNPIELPINLDNTNYIV